ncbi:MAG: hypothetical protein V3T70_00295, partial [Phycisphaerae bacterium]
MQRVYTYERPARPVLAPVVAGAALLATLAGAWQLKAIRTAPVELDQPIRLPGWPIEFAPPKNWTVVTESSDEPNPWRDAISYVDRRADGPPLRLTVYYDTLHSGITARIAAAQHLGVSRDSNLLSEPRAFAGLYGHTMQAVLPRAGRHVTISAAVLPNGRTCGVVVTGDGQLGAGAVNLHRSVCASITWTRPELSREPPEAYASNGLTCRPPEHAWFVADPDDATGALYVTAGASASFGWQAELYPTFLVGDRTVEDLLYDFLVNDEFRIEPSAPIDVQAVNGGQTAAALTERNGLATAIRVIELNHDRAAIIMATSEAAHADRLSAVCERLTSELKAVNGAWPFETTRSRDRGAALMNHTLRNPLSRLFPEAQTHLVMVQEDADKIRGRREEHTKVVPGESGAAHGSYRFSTGERHPTFSMAGKWSLGFDDLTFDVFNEVTIQRQALPTTVYVTVKGS